MQPAGAIPRLRRHLDGELIVVRPGIEAGLRPCAHVSSRSWLFANSRPGAGSPWTLLAACMVLSAVKYARVAYHFAWPGIGHVAKQGDGFRWYPESVVL